MVTRCRCCGVLAERDCTECTDGTCDHQTQTESGAAALLVGIVGAVAQQRVLSARAWGR